MKISGKFLTSLAVTCVAVLSGGLFTVQADCPTGTKPTSCYCNDTTVGDPIPSTCCINGELYAYIKTDYVYDSPKYFSSCGGKGCNFGMSGWAGSYYTISPLVDQNRLCQGAIGPVGPSSPD